MRTSHTLFLIGLAILLPLSALPLLAQDEGDLRGRGRGRLDEFRQMKLIDAVDMTEDQSIRYFAREKEFRQQEEEIQSRRRELITKLSKLNQQSSSDEEILKSVQQIGTVSQELVRKRTDFILGLKDFLSSKQIAQLVVFEDSFLRQVKRVIKKYSPPRNR